MIRNKLSSKSIIVKLTFVTIISFVIMLLVSNYMIGQKQMQIAQELTKHLEESINAVEPDNKLLFVIDEAQIQTMAEYRVYAGIVMAVTVLIGSTIFIIVIRRILYPLKTLTEKVNQIDMEKWRWTRPSSWAVWTRAPSCANSSPTSSSTTRLDTAN